VRRELTEASTDLRAWHDLRREIDVNSVMSGFYGEKPLIEFAERSVCQSVRQDPEAFAASGLDEGRAQELIHEPRRLEAPRGAQQPPCIGAWALASKGDPALRQHPQNGAEVLELLTRDPGERLEKRGVFRTAKEQRHGRAGGLLLAVRVIDKDLVELPKDP
jgi:hypothetical protein